MQHCPKCGVRHSDSVIACDCGYELVPREVVHKKDSLREMGVGASLIFIAVFTFLFLTLIHAAFWFFLGGVLMLAKGLIDYSHVTKRNRGSE
jgi:fucose permease